jgi:Ca2+/H+ antiporter, TMEM165/GDT1 family
MGAMESFWISFSSIAIAEMGDRTQLLSLVLVAHYRRPWPILAGVTLATLANHVVAGAIGAWVGSLLTPTVLDLGVGISMLAMAGWTLKPDRPEKTAAPHAGVFVATSIAFFLAEIGDKTQLATVALAAGYPNLVAVVAGTTTGMVAANVPVIFLGRMFAERLPLATIHIGAAALFAVLGLWFIARGLLG